MQKCSNERGNNIFKKGIKELQIKKRKIMSRNK